MTLDLNQMEWRGLVLGRPGPLRFQKVTGLTRTMPNLRSGSKPRPRRHGAYPSSDFSDGRTIGATVQVQLNGSDPRWDDINAVADAATGPLSLRFRTIAGGRELVVPEAQFQGFTSPLAPEQMVGAGMLDAEWWCPDPLLYEAVQRSATTGPASGGGGLSWPLTWPLDWGGLASGGQLTALNEGNTATPWVAVINGPSSNPRIINQVTGQALRITGEVAEGQTLVVDSADWSVLLNGEIDRYTWLAVGSAWFALDPGYTILQYAPTAGTGEMTLLWRSAWHG